MPYIDIIESLPNARNINAQKENNMAKFENIKLLDNDCTNIHPYDAGICSEFVQNQTIFFSPRILTVMKTA